MSTGNVSGPDFDRSRDHTKRVRVRYDVRTKSLRIQTTELSSIEEDLGRIVRPEHDDDKRSCHTER